MLVFLLAHNRSSESARVVDLVYYSETAAGTISASPKGSDPHDDEKDESQNRAGNAENPEQCHLSIDHRYCSEVGSMHEGAPRLVEVSIASTEVPPNGSIGFTQDALRGSTVS